MTTFYLGFVELFNNTPKDSRMLPKVSLKQISHLIYIKPQNITENINGFPPQYSIDYKHVMAINYIAQVKFDLAYLGLHEII